MGKHDLEKFKGQNIELSLSGCSPIQGVLRDVIAGNAEFADGSIVNLASSSFVARPLPLTRSASNSMSEYIDHNGDSTFWPSRDEDLNADPGHPYNW